MGGLGGGEVGGGFVFWGRLIERLLGPAPIAGPFFGILDKRMNKKR